MPFAEIAGGRIHYRFDGPAGAPVLLLSNSLGTGLTLWEKQIAALSRSFRLLRYDARGHGSSLVSPEPYSIQVLAGDVVSVLDRLGIPRVHFCGLSLGGMVGMWLAAHEPARIERLVLANTSPLMGPRDAWEKRILAVRQGGMDAIATSVIERWFTQGFRQESPGEVLAVRQGLLATPPEGYIGSCAAIRDMDQREMVESIGLPTLVIAGAHDPATPPAMCRGIAEAIAGARYVELSAAHLSNIEAAGAFNDAVADFLLE